MSYNHRGNGVEPFSPLGNVDTTGAGSGVGATLYQSPASYPQPWEPYHGDLGSPDYEMGDLGGNRSRSGTGGIDGRPPMRSQPNSMGSMASEYSTASTLFPSHTRMSIYTPSSFPSILLLSRIQIHKMANHQFLRYRQRTRILPPRSPLQDKHRHQRPHSPLQRPWRQATPHHPLGHVLPTGRHDCTMYHLWRCGYTMAEEGPEDGGPEENL